MKTSSPNSILSYLCTAAAAELGSRFWLQLGIDGPLSLLKKRQTDRPTDNNLIKQEIRHKHMKEEDSKS